MEDEDALRSAYKFLLESQGYTVHTASNGIEGLEALQKHLPNIVLLDVEMPLLNGIEVLKKVSKKIRSACRIIVFSNSTDNEIIEQAFTYGADNFLVKAATAPKDLLKTIASY